MSYSPNEMQYESSQHQQNTIEARATIVQDFESSSCLEADGAVLNDEALLRLHAQPLCRNLVDDRVRLLHGDIISGNEDVHGLRHAGAQLADNCGARAHDICFVAKAC